MSDINITTLIAQMPYLQNVAVAQQAHPETQQLFAAQMAQQVFKQQHDQVQRVETQEETHSVRKDKDERQGPRQRTPQQAKRQADAPEAEAAPDPGGSPWLGHLVNRKV